MIKSHHQHDGFPKRDRTEKVEQKEVNRIITDPESGWMNRPKKPTGYHYLGHTSIDTKHGIITDIHVKPGNVHDSEPYVKRLTVQKNKFGLNIQKAGADKGYDSSLIHNGLDKLQIKGYITPRKYVGIEDKDGKGFVYDRESDSYTCPAGKILPFACIEGKDVVRQQVYAAKTKD